MAKYEIQMKESVLKDLDKIPKKDLDKILEKINLLAENPYIQGSIKLSNQNRYRYRVGNYRILYSIENQILTVVIVKVAHRKDAYKI